MRPGRKRVHSFTVWMNDAELKQITAVLGEEPKGEIVRDYFVNAAKPRPDVLAVLGEVSLIRTAFFDMIPAWLRGSLTTAEVSAFIKAATKDRFPLAEAAIGQAKQHLESQQGGTQA